MKNTIFNLLRPIYRPVMSVIRNKLVTEHSFIRYPEMEVPRPWDYVQFKVERDLHTYLHTKPEEIKSVVVVGANLGGEVTDVGRTYKNARFTLFEPSPRYFPELQRLHGNKPHVKCLQKACGSQSGETAFYELPLNGNGSFLKPSASWKDFNQQTNDTVIEYKVQVTTLDHEIDPNTQLDLLWADVQGAELHVLQGAQHTLQRTKAVFLEVSLCDSPYEHGALLHELNALLLTSGHKLTLLGLDPWNYTGNALWIKNPENVTLK